MNIDELFKLVMNEKASVETFHAVLEHQLKEEAAKRKVIKNEELSSSSDDDSSNEGEEIENEEKQITDEEQGEKKDVALIAFLNTRNSEGNTLLHEAAKKRLI